MTKYYKVKKNSKDGELSTEDVIYFVNGEIAVRGVGLLDYGKEITDRLLKEIDFDPEDYLPRFDRHGWSTDLHLAPEGVELEVVALDINDDEKVVLLGGCTVEGVRWRDGNGDYISDYRLKAWGYRKNIEHFR